MAVENRIKIGDFVKLTGSTLKTVNYYHKIGLLPEPPRTDGGYRLYGLEDLNRMQLIKHLKSLGMSLKQIKEIIGNLDNQRTSREVLQSLRSELLSGKQTLEERIAKIDAVLSNNAPLLDDDCFGSASFQMITEILGAEQIERYSDTCPRIYDQHRRLSGILDDFQWGNNHREGFRILAEYFKNHPEQYQLALESGARWEEVSHLDEDDPRIEAFAREAAALVNSMPPVKELYRAQPAMNQPLESLYQKKVAGVLTPAQIKYQQLFKKLLLTGD